MLRFARLPFGLTCSSYILAAVLKRHMERADIDQALAAEILAAFYVDDQVFSVDTLQGLFHRQAVTRTEFAKANMNVRQWNANSEEAREKFRREGDDPPDTETVLGLRWDVKSDLISVNAERIEALVGKQPKSKRMFWSFVAQVFDPLGLIAPYTTLAKLLTREVSKACKNWDSKLPQDLSDRVSQWMEDFVLIPDMTFPRHVGIFAAKSEKLVCFCDASKKALGVCIYLVSTDGEGNIVSNLWTAKSRIAPYPVQTIPRLELTAAVLAVNVMSHVRQVIPEVTSKNIYFMSDSRIVIFWLYSCSLSWPKYVANRLVSITAGSEVEQWGHVDTDENPSDLPSRGVPMSDLLISDLWKHGPMYLREGKMKGKSTVDGYQLVRGKMPESCTEELKVFSLIAQADMNNNSFNISEVLDMSLYGTYDKIMSQTEALLTFIQNCVVSNGMALKGFMKDDSMRKRAEIEWIKAIQRKHYNDLFKLCASSEASVLRTMRSFYKDHQVFLDENLGVLRITTRLQDSLLPYETTHPILLPPKDRLTDLYILKVHEDNGHAGLSQTLTYIRSEFWIPTGRSVVKYVLHRCNPCRKVSGPFYSMPKHPPLPSMRVQRARVFKSVGIDFIGPMTIRDEKYDTWRKASEKEKKRKEAEKQGRRRKTRSSGKKPKEPPPAPKAYILIFTCLASRAVHLEATLGRTVDDLLMGMQRFMNVRGIPERVESDAAKEFIRVDKELSSIYNSSRVRKFCNQKRIHWHTYTERAPWKGGACERINALCKSVCKKTYGKAILSFDEFRTMVSYSMSVVNDRPITYVYSDLCSSGVEITPSMLLGGHKINEPPHLSWRRPRDKDELKLGERYMLLERLKDSFWARWHKEYLTSLTERHVKQGKTTAAYLTPKENDIVLVKNENTPRRKWRLGRILSVRKSERDGVIREVSLITTNDEGKRSFIRRSPSFLVPLEAGTRYIHPEGQSKSKQADKKSKIGKTTTFCDETLGG